MMTMLWFMLNNVFIPPFARGYTYDRRITTVVENVIMNLLIPIHHLTLIQYFDTY